MTYLYCLICMCLAVLLWSLLIAFRVNVTFSFSLAIMCIWPLCSACRVSTNNRTVRFLKLKVEYAIQVATFAVYANLFNLNAETWVIFMFVYLCMEILLWLAIICFYREIPISFDFFWQKPPTTTRTIDTYAAQCEECLKWRVIDTVEEYEEIRSKNIEEPFVCERKPGVSCEDPADIEYNQSRIWVIDKPGLPKSPEGFKRRLVLRKDLCKIDAYYVSPTGKRFRSHPEVATFLQGNPGYGVSLDDFNFTRPKVVEEDSVPAGIFGQRSISGSDKKP